MLLALLLLAPREARAYSVLAHEANIDALWETSLRPLLARRYPRATRDEVGQARTYAYGGGYARRYDDYGGIRIQGAPRNAEVYVDGAYAGIVDDYDGVFQRLELEPGAHEVEIHTAGRPMVYDVNVTLGQTVTIHANVR